MFDAIDFKWNEEKLYKENYMQDPFNILTKENLDKLEKHCKKAIHYERKDGLLEHQITLDLLYKYQDQEKELKKKDKIINEMTKEINKIASEKYKIKHICEAGKCEYEECHEDNWNECIRRYFEKKVEGEKLC